MSLTYEQRQKYFTNPTALQLLSYAEEKQTNLILSLDLTRTTDCLHLLKKVASQICMVKLHIDIIEDFSHDFILSLQALAAQEKFLLFEDRKFADIGNTTQLQYERGIYRIAEWAHLITGHSVAGPGLIQALKAGGLAHGHAMLLLAQMSAKDHLMDENYLQKTIEYAKVNRDFVIGFISLEKLLPEPHFLYFTPGVQINQRQDHLGQQYLTPEKVIGENGSDFIIVGRGIYAHEDPITQARKYRQAGWEAYQQRYK